MFDLTEWIWVGNPLYFLFVSIKNEVFLIRRFFFKIGEVIFELIEDI